MYITSTVSRQLRFLIRAAGHRYNSDKIMAPSSRSTGSSTGNKAQRNDDSDASSRILKGKESVPSVLVPTVVHMSSSPREQLERLESERDRQRQKMEDLGRQKLEIDTAMTKLARTLEQLDHDIESLEIGLLKSNSTSSSNNTAATTIVKAEVTVKSETGTAATVKAEPMSTTNTTSSTNVENVGYRNDTEISNMKENITNTSNPYSHNHRTASNRWTMTTTTQYEDHEILTDPHVTTLTATTTTTPVPSNEYLTEPQYCEDDDFQIEDDDDDDDEENDYEEHDENAYVNSYVQQQQHEEEQELEDHRKMPARCDRDSTTTTTVRTNPPQHRDSILVTGTLMPTQPNNHSTRSNITSLHHHHHHHHIVTPPNESTRTYPWTTKIFDLLQNTFRIPSFREQQLDIINTTMEGKDVFVIMRTGGGKSLTYQLPALYEGRFGSNSTNGGRNSNKITLVISPLLSLIQDQEEQMNMFAPGSAISFTSSIGTAEHNRRWNQVQDPHSGVCLIFCTPEKVSKSNRLCSELDKLHAKNRLGRFVIDEAHCACQWGHDFRPDYAKLGKLKSHFPSIPIIAVTATASDRVRDDVCEILRIRHDYQFFRSTFCRPNLIYSVIPKPDKNDTIIELMVNFIKTKYPRDAGIVYTYSRKDADNVADALCNLGVIAEPYHSDVSVSTKEAVHKSWMRNETQVVVATIAFGLGINKPDVRFVLHHSISKTLEAYYQESGRAGRDGNPSECVLYYNPKDVMRMLKMVHGSSSEHLVWPMVRYAQQSGNDAICKAILLTHLGEPNAPDVMQVVSENEGIVTERRDVGKHAKTVVELLHIRMVQDANVTLAMLVKDWRSTGAGAEQCVKDNPPKKDGLTQDDCERIVTSLLLENVISTNPKWNAYDTVIYLVLGELGPNMLSSTNPKFVMRFPRREVAKVAAVLPQPTKAAKQSTLRKTLTTNGEWLSTKPVSVKRKKAATVKTKPIKKIKAKPTKKPVAKAFTKTKAAKSRTTGASAEVIELSSDDDDSDPDVPLVSLRKVEKRDNEDRLWNDDDDDDASDEENEFDE